MSGWHKQRFEFSPTKVELACLHCGRRMWLPPSKRDEYRTCGGECAKAHRQAALSARERNCLTCGKEFTPRAYQVANGQGKFCSQKCNAVSHAAMNSQEAQKLARQRWRIAYDRKKAADPNFMSGSNNPHWKGGWAARYQRLKALDKFREAYNNRRARKVGRLPPGITNRLATQQRWKCAACETSIRAGFHLDHIMPLARGGSNTVENVQLLCPTCNRRKASKHPIDFMQSLGKLL